MKEPELHVVTLMLCDLCLDGKGGECHSPGCALWINRAPDMPIRANVLSIDGKAGPAYDPPDCAFWSPEDRRWER